MNGEGQEFNVLVPHLALRSSPKYMAAWKRFSQMGPGGSPLYQVRNWIKGRLSPIVRYDLEGAVPYDDFATMMLWTGGALWKVPFIKEDWNTWDLSYQGDRQYSLDWALRTFDYGGGTKPYNAMNTVEKLLFARTHGLAIPNVENYYEDVYDEETGEIVEKVYEPTEEDIGWMFEINAMAKTPLLLSHFAYCITGHASQGSQFDNVYVESTPHNLFKLCKKLESKYPEDKADAHQALQELLRWMYVVVTRAGKQLGILTELECKTYSAAPSTSRSTYKKTSYKKNPCRRGR